MTTDRTTRVDTIFKAITDLLPMIYDREVDDEFLKSHFIVNSNRDEILSTEEGEIEAIANLFDQLYGEGTCNTGFYDPEEDDRNGEVDAYTGLYYVTIA